MPPPDRHQDSILAWPHLRTYSSSSLAALSHVHPAPPSPSLLSLHSAVADGLCLSSAQPYTGQVMSGQAGEAQRSSVGQKMHSNSADTHTQTDGCCDGAPAARSHDLKHRVCHNPLPALPDNHPLRPRLATSPAHCLLPAPSLQCSEESGHFLNIRQAGSKQRHQCCTPPPHHHP